MIFNFLLHSQLTHVNKKAPGGIINYLPVACHNPSVFVLHLFPNSRTGAFSGINAYLPISCQWKFSCMFSACTQVFTNNVESPRLTRKGRSEPQLPTCQLLSHTASNASCSMLTVQSRCWDGVQGLWCFQGGCSRCEEGKKLKWEKDTRNFWSGASL